MTTITVIPQVLSPSFEEISASIKELNGLVGKSAQGTEKCTANYLTSSFFTFV